MLTFDNMDPKNSRDAKYPMHKNVCKISKHINKFPELKFCETTSYKLIQAN